MAIAKIVIKIVGILISIAIVISGIVVAPMLFRLVNAESYINGELNVQNEFNIDNFYYASNSLVFYEDIYATENKFSLNIELVKVTDFNGLENTYSIVLNDYPMLNNNIDAGRITSTFNIDFFDVENQLIQNAQMNIKIDFLDDKTTLTLATQTIAESTFLSTYFNSNGFRLRIEQII